MEYAIGGVLLAAAFLLGLTTGDGRWAWLAALLPLGMFAWTGIAAATEDKSDCYETCGSEFLLIFSAVSVFVAIILGGAVALGASVARRGEEPARKRKFVHRRTF